MTYLDTPSFAQQCTYEIAAVNVPIKHFSDKYFRQLGQDAPNKKEQRPTRGRCLFLVAGGGMCRSRLEPRPHSLRYGALAKKGICGIRSGLLAACESQTCKPDAQQRQRSRFRHSRNGNGVERTTERIVYSHRLEPQRRRRGTADNVHADK